MSRRGRLNQCIAVLFSLVLCPPVLAQSSHLRALSDWMVHEQEAAKSFQNGDYSQAVERLTLAIRDIRPYLPETRRIMAKSYCDLAQVLYHQQRYDEAEPLARWALSVREADKKARPDTVFQCFYVLGRIQSARKNHAEAEQLYLRSLVLQEKSWGAIISTAWPFSINSRSFTSNKRNTPTPKASTGDRSQFSSATGPLKTSFWRKPLKSTPSYSGS